MHRGDNTGYSVTSVLEEGLPTMANFQHYLAQTVLQYLRFGHLAPNSNCVHTDCSNVNDSQNQEPNNLKIGWSHPRNMTFQRLLYVCMDALVPDTVIRIMSMSSQVKYFSFISIVSKGYILKETRWSQATSQLVASVTVALGCMVFNMQPCWQSKMLQIKDICFVMLPSEHIVVSTIHSC